jgi:hypothetical protein
MLYSEHTTENTDIPHSYKIIFMFSHITEIHDSHQSHAQDINRIKDSSKSYKVTIDYNV